MRAGSPMRAGACALLEEMSEVRRSIPTDMKHSAIPEDTFPCIQELHYHDKVWERGQRRAYA